MVEAGEDEHGRVGVVGQRGVQEGRLFGGRHDGVFAAEQHQHGRLYLVPARRREAAAAAEVAEVGIAQAFGDERVLGPARGTGSGVDPVVCRPRKSLLRVLHSRDLIGVGGGVLVGRERVAGGAHEGLRDVPLLLREPRRRPHHRDDERHVARPVRGHVRDDPPARAVAHEPHRADVLAREQQVERGVHVRRAALGGVDARRAGGAPRARPVEGERGDALAREQPPPERHLRP